MNANYVRELGRLSKTTSKTGFIFSKVIKGHKEDKKNVLFLSDTFNL